MDSGISLLERAEIDLNACEMFLAKSECNELFLDAAAFHVQQAVEKSLKYWLTKLDVPYPEPKTYDVFIHIVMVEHAGHTPPEWLFENGDLLNGYEWSARYGISIVGDKEKVAELLAKATALVTYLKTEAKDHVGIAL